MNNDLRRDLIAIILEETAGYREDLALRMAAGHYSGIARRDAETLLAAINAVDRIDARCSKIEGRMAPSSVECPHCHWGFAPSAITQHIREKHEGSPE